MKIELNYDGSPQIKITKQIGTAKKRKSTENFANELANGNTEWLKEHGEPTSNSQQ